MQFEKAKQKRKDWGDKTCDHPSIEKEYYLGAQTSDYVCTQCGAEFTKSEKDKIRESRTE